MIGGIAPCGCSPDADGNCAPCLATVSKFARGFADVVGVYLEARTKIEAAMEDTIRTILKETPDPCDTCAKRYTDFALAKLIPELGKFGEKRARGTYRMILGMFAEELLKHPLSEKAWTDLCTQQRWRKD